MDLMDYFMTLLIPYCCIVGNGFIYISVSAMLCEGIKKRSCEDQAMKMDYYHVEHNRR